MSCLVFTLLLLLWLSRLSGWPTPTTTSFRPLIHLTYLTSPNRKPAAANAFSSINKRRRPLPFVARPPSKVFMNLGRGGAGGGAGGGVTSTMVTE